MRDKKASLSERDQIFANGEEDIFDAQLIGQVPPDFVAGKCSNHAIPIPLAKTKR